LLYIIKDNVAMDNSTEPFNALAVTMNGNKRADDQMPAAHYTMPGILHYLQTEWARFEMDRAQWEVDRAELQVHHCCLRCITNVISTGY